MLDEKGSALGALRKRHGWKQHELSEQSGIPAQTIGTWEWGERAMGIDRLSLLATALGEPDALVLECALHDLYRVRRTA